MSAPDQLEHKLANRKESGNYRVLIQKKGLADFSSNDYLGLSGNKILHRSILSELVDLPNGSTGSRLLSGNSSHIEDAENYLADILQAECALIFESGYMANLAVFSTLPQRGDTVIYDELSHACIKDGIRLSHAKKVSFKHNDLKELRKKLQNAEGKKYVALESVYSMDGDECPLVEVVNLADEFDAKIIIDEAHGTGVYGNNGAGLSEMLGLTNRLFVRIYTFGKAMGIHGAVVVGGHLMRNFLVNFARPFIYTTAPSPYAVVAAKSAFKYLIENIHLQEQIKEHVHFFNEQFQSCVGQKFEKINSNHAIQSVIIPGNQRAKRVAEELQKNGYDVRPILSPTVAEEKERIRICLHTFNSRDEISGLIHSLAGL